MEHKREEERALEEEVKASIGAKRRTFSMMWAWMGTLLLEPAINCWLS